MKAPKLNCNKKKGGGNRTSNTNKRSTKMQNNKPQSHDRKKRKKNAKKQSGTPNQKTKRRSSWKRDWRRRTWVSSSGLTALPARLCLSYSALSQLSSADSFGPRANRQCQPRRSKKWLTISSIDVAVSALISRLSVRTHIDLRSRGLWGCLHKNTTGSAQDRAPVGERAVFCRLSPAPLHHPSTSNPPEASHSAGHPPSAIRPRPHPSPLMRAVDRWALTKRRWRRSPPTAVCQQHLGSWKKNKKNKFMMWFFFFFLAVTRFWNKKKCFKRIKYIIEESLQK